MIAISTPPRSARTARPSRIVPPKPGTIASGSRSGSSHRSLSASRTRSGTAVPPLAGERQRRVARAVRVERAVDEPAVAAHDPRARDRGELRRSAAPPGRSTTFAPGAIASRRPQAAARSKRSVRLVSKKWKCDVTPTGTSPSLTTSSATPLLQPLGLDRLRRPAAASRRIGSCSTTSRCPSVNSGSTSIARDGVGDAVEHVVLPEHRVAERLDVGVARARRAPPRRPRRRSARSPRPA